MPGLSRWAAGNTGGVHRVWAAHRAAARIERDHVEAATMATESWLGLVWTRVVVIADDERLVQETVALGIHLLESGQSHAPRQAAAWQGTLASAPARDSCRTVRPAVGVA